MALGWFARLVRKDQSCIPTRKLRRCFNILVRITASGAAQGKIYMAVDEGVISALAHVPPYRLHSCCLRELLGPMYAVFTPVSSCGWTRSAPSLSRSCFRLCDSSAMFSHSIAHDGSTVRHVQARPRINTSLIASL